MDISRYFAESNGAVSFTEEQASAFAKGIAGDFNPIHDSHSKRFCVPGDLLFSVLLHRYGAARTTRVQFSGMLDGNTRMLMPTSVAGEAFITDARDRALLNLTLEGERIVNQAFITQLSRAYVHFSGQTFPDILVPLMRGAGVMINPDRPLVIYRDMSIELNDSAFELFSQTSDRPPGDQQEFVDSGLTLELADTDISVDGRKGLVRLSFTMAVGASNIGSGGKNMVLSGLREYDETAMQHIVDQYNQWRQSYQQNESVS